ncbi:MAG: 3'-5' exonuclease [Gammaproteobacteria bacterium]|jgi:DNA polymerase-3 subunit epsilon
MKWFGRSRQSGYDKVAPKDPALQSVYQSCTTLDPRQVMKTPVNETRFVIIDTETTGFQAYADDEIVSIAMLELTGLHTMGQEYQTFINPQRSIPESSTEIHGITDDDVNDAPALNEALPDIIQFIGDAVIIGHHINFDLRFLNRRLQKLIGCSLPNPWIDTMLLFLELTGKMGHYSLENVAQAAGVEIKNRHTAYGDAMATLQIFQVMAQQMVKDKEPVSRLISMQYNNEL